MINDIRCSLLDDAINNDFAGFDPFDGLNVFLIFSRVYVIHYSALHGFRCSNARMLICANFGSSKKATRKGLLYLSQDARAISG